MRILIVGATYPWALETWYFNAFVRLGQSVDRFSIDDRRLLRHGPGIVRRIGNRLIAGVNDAVVCRALLAKLQENKYDLVLVFKGMEFDLPFLQRCRIAAGGATWVNYYPDDPLNLASRGSTSARVVRAIPFFDLYVVWTPKLIPALTLAGARRVASLPFGFDAQAHRPLPGVTEATSLYISFVGAWDREREAMLAPLADVGLRVYGDNWNRVALRSPLRGCVFPGNVFGAAFARIVGESAVSLNLLRAQNAGSHNMRTFEIPAMGGVMLTTRSEEQQQLFPEEAAALMFSTRVELRESVERLLADAELRQKFRMEGMRRAAPHTYDSRAARLLELIA